MQIPSLPKKTGVVSIPAQEWPRHPGPRAIQVYLHYPGGELDRVTAQTGLMLSLHNWNGTGFAGAPEPDFLAEHYDVVAIGVDYLQSGPYTGEHPYDFGWLQALDALRALFFVYDALKKSGVPFAKERLFATGGSGGGQVSLMANKLAPNTFAAVVDICGMKKLSDDIAFGEGKTSTLNARYSRDPASPDYLTAGMRELRFLGHPAHLARMKATGCTAKIFSVHGINDASCPFADAEEFAQNLRSAGLDFTFVPVTEKELDGEAFTSADHALGNRTLILDRVAGWFLRADGPDAVRKATPNNFELRNEISYATRDGEWTVDYAHGFPEGRGPKKIL